MLRNSLFCLLIVILASVLCTDARKQKLPGGKRTSCETFGQRDSSRAICIDQVGKSGKMKISLGKNREENDPKSVTIEFDAIRELDADENQVGKSGARSLKHSFENFANLEFEYSDLENTTYQGVRAVGFNFSAKIPGTNATLNVPIYIFKENKTIDLCDDEYVNVIRRMVKFNIELMNWNFCKAGSGCKKGQKEEIGKFVEIEIKVKNVGKALKGKKDKKEKGKKHKAMKFFFGRNSVAFPSTVLSDGVCATMPEVGEGNPALRKNTIVFRFEKFNEKVVYDPAVNLEEEETPPEPDDSGAKLLYPSFGVVMILGVLARLFF